MKRTLQIIMLCFIIGTAAMAQNAPKVEIMDLTTQSFKQKVWNFDKDKSFNRVGDLPIILRPLQNAGTSSSGYTEQIQR